MTQQQTLLQEQRETSSLLIAHNILAAWHMNHQSKEKLQQAIDNTTDTRTAQNIWQMLQAQPCTLGQCHCGCCI